MARLDTIERLCHSVVFSSIARLQQNFGRPPSYRYILYSAAGASLMWKSVVSSPCHRTHPYITKGALHPKISYGLKKRVGHLKKVGSAAAHNPDILARTIHVLAFGSPAFLMRLGATSLQSSASGTPIPITTSNRALANSGMAGQLKRLVNGLVAGGHCHRLWHSVLGGN